MSLEMRRIRFDMIETFKMLNSFSDVDYTNWFNLIPPTARQTRSNTGYMNLEKFAEHKSERISFPSGYHLSGTLCLTTSKKAEQSSHSKSSSTSGPS